jgi:hypothetical protein
MDEGLPLAIIYFCAHNSPAPLLVQVNYALVYDVVMVSVVKVLSTTC